MFDRNSRYSRLSQRIYTDRAGKDIVYQARRILPQPADLTTLMEVTVVDGMRLDTIAASTLGDPEQYWRICDANAAMNPFDLVDTPGSRIRISKSNG